MSDQLRRRIAPIANAKPVRHVTHRSAFGQQTVK